MDLITDQLIMNYLNLTEKDIEDIRMVREKDHKIFYVSLSRSERHYCPVCGSVSYKSLGFYQRKITMSHKLCEKDELILKVRRYLCRDCHTSFSEDKHLAQRNQTISYQVILKLMELLKDPHMTFKNAAALCSISPSSAVRIFDRHCHLKRPVFPEALCMDEVYALNSDFDSKYICVFYDFFRHTVIDVLPSRKKDYLYHYFQQFENTGELLSVKYVCIDMHNTYRYIARKYFKKAVICADSFHVIKQLNDSLSKVRIRIMKRYDTASIEYYLLKHFRFLLFERNIDLDNKARWNKKLERYINLRQLKEELLSIDPQLKRAYELKEDYTSFNASSSYEEAEEKLGKLIDEFTLANIPEYEEFTSSLRRWKKEIVNSFRLYKGRRISNGVAESINSLISLLLFNSKGIRNSERRKKRIMYAVNKEGFLLK